MLRRVPPVALALMLLFSPRLRAEAPLHAQVVVFIPAYEGSALYDPDLAGKGDDPPCVWGSIDAIRRSDLYLALRMPNPLVAKPMLTAGPVDVYGKFVNGLTDDHDGGFHAYTPGADFFIFAYDWRQEIATVTAPLLGEALDHYAQIHEARTGIPAGETRFILVCHSMGGLVARTLISEKPELADRITSLYLVGTPNLGSVKAIKTLIVGPGGLKENAVGFPETLLNLLPNDVDAATTKLVAVTRPSLYELLPFDDPRWEIDEATGRRSSVSAADLLSVEPWRNYWPSAELEQRVFLNDWLRRRETEGRKQVNEPDWEFCQDPDLRQLQGILAQVREWRLRMGSLRYTDTLLTRPGEPSRLKVVIGTGIKTATGIITGGAHDFSIARYTYAPDNDGDETVTSASVLDDLHPAETNIRLLPGVTHGRLMNDPRFLSYLYAELAREPVLKRSPDRTADSTPVRLVPGATVP
jgi:pimeloyl-ACP methyl ester carboxylesterase